MYCISREGRAALDGWLETVEPGARDTFFLNLFAGGLTTPEVANSNRGHDWFHRHMLVHAIERSEQELAWAAGVARALGRGPR